MTDIEPGSAAACSACGLACCPPGYCCYGEGCDVRDNAYYADIDYPEIRQEAPEWTI